MSKYNYIKYDKARKRIHQYIKEGKSKEEILNGGSTSVGFLKQFLAVNNESEGWPDITENDWMELVEIELLESESMSQVEIQEGVTFSNKEKNNFKIPEHKNSTWQVFVKRVLEDRNKFDQETIKSIEKDVYNIVQNLNIKSNRDIPVKGLTIGSVQSGKTTNMAALMAMASDMGFNMFIILSGMIENLRIQNEARIYDMLKPTTGKSTIWERISNDRDHLERLSKVYGDGSSLFTVVLKNKNRLESLIEWLQEDQNYAKKLKILVIDDESDQASINTLYSKTINEDRTTINRLISNLVYNKTVNGEDYPTKYETINYVGYTATPYANILSESPDSKYSLYPNTFITTLSKSSRYIGPTEIFGELGTNNEGLDLINYVNSPLKLNVLKDTIEITKELKDAMSYFIAAGASLRKHKFNKPVSMLIQVSHKIDDHFNIMRAIKKWFNYDKEKIMKNIEDVWNNEYDRLMIQDLSKVIKIDKSSFIPHRFIEIKDEVESIIETIKPIKVGAADNDYQYHKGVHLVVDNSDDRLKGSNKKYRLKYPEKDEDNMITPLFLIIGGNTLSRGLTIEGLTSTYFLRTPTAADTLTQMGRWFGYRINYELYPRIWTTKKTYNNFQYISTVEKELRDEIIEMNKIGLVPEEVGPRIKYLPQYLNITSREKSRAMKTAEYDFTGYSSQTYIFDKDVKIQKHNIRVAESFINSLGKPKISRSNNKDNIYWENVNTKKIIRGLFNKFKFNKRIKSLNNIDEFSQWILSNTKNGNLTNWNVILGGLGKSNVPSNDWILEHVEYNMITRTKLNTSLDNEINIGVLRSPADLYSDINLDLIDKNLKEEINKNISTGNRMEYTRIREKLNLGKTPQLIIYKIDRNSTPNKTRNNRREKLGIDSDLIGIYISIPGKTTKDYISYVTVEIKNDVLEHIGESDLND